MNVHSKWCFMKNDTDRLNKKERIIEAAVIIFAHKGFYNATVKDVALKAGVADGTIYNYFKNKDDLLISLFEQKMEAILDRFQKSIDSVDNPAGKLVHLIHTHFEIIEEDCRLAEVFQVELRQSSKFLKNYHNQKFSDFLNMISSIIKTGKADGSFRTDLDVDVIKVMIFGSIDEVARQWILGASEKYNLRSAANQIVTVICEGVLKR
ncbi:MAG: TetR family transcriptional regulator [Caldithrix sp.]|nr:TetR family transcriptional regulator [Caldithrix sp.]